MSTNYSNRRFYSSACGVIFPLFSPAVLIFDSQIWAMSYFMANLNQQFELLYKCFLTQLNCCLNSLNVPCFYFKARQRFPNRENKKQVPRLLFFVQTYFKECCKSCFFSSKNDGFLGLVSEKTSLWIFFLKTCSVSAVAWSNCEGYPITWCIKFLVRLRISSLT